MGRNNCGQSVRGEVDVIGRAVSTGTEGIGSFLPHCHKTRKQ